MLNYTENLRSGTLYPNPGQADGTAIGSITARRLTYAQVVLWINWGAGLRVYLMKDGDEIIILLCAGFKVTQDSDLDKAQSYRADYLKRRG